MWMHKEKCTDIETVIDNTLAGMGVFEVKGGKLTVVFLNDGFFRMLGYSKAECSVSLRNIEANIIGEDLLMFRQGITDVLKDDGWSEIEFRTVTKDGGIRWLQVRGNLFYRDDDHSLITAIILDITERKMIELELVEQAERLHLLSEAENEIIFDYNAKTDVLAVKGSKGTPIKDILIKDFIQNGTTNMILEEDLDSFWEIAHSTLKKPLKDAIDIRTRLFSNSEIRWSRINFTSLLGTEGYITRVVGRITDIHEKKLAELQIEERAERDPLTGLYNKGTTKELIEKKLEEINAKDDFDALIMLDLDNFKAINDNLGHAMGDSVLIETANHLKANFKGRDIIGRIGGDEFVIYMNDVNEVKNVQLHGYKLNRLLTKDYPCDGGTISVTASIGIAIAGLHGKTFQELYENADKALYKTKKNGKNGCTLFESET